MQPIYSRAQFGAGRPLQKWREVMNETFFSIGCDSDTAQANPPFDGSIAWLSVGEAGLYAIGSEAVRYERHPDDIRRSASDTCQLFLVLDGQVHISQHGRQTTIGPGQSCMYAAGEPFRLDMPGRYRSLVLTMPRALLAHKLPGFERLTARTMDGLQGMSRLLNQLMRDASSIDDTAIGAAALSRLGAPMTDMVALALEAELEGIAPLTTRHSQLLGRIKSRMLDQIDNPDIDVKQVAGDLGVGIRTLNRMFAAEGTTALRWLWQQRIAASHRLLTQGRSTRVAEVALSCGFSDFSHFSRVFKREFGITPNSLIKR